MYGRFDGLTSINAVITVRILPAYE